MVLRIPGKWVWDSWYVRDGDTFHAYVLQADDTLGDPDLRHFNVSQGHATSRDLVTWDYLGTCLAPAPGPAWDDFTTWTGSVVQDDAGLWHLFYTGARRVEQGLYQRIGHATSPDLHSWQRVGTGLALDMTGPASGAYEAEHAIGHWHDRAMRDPWVMRDPDGDGWLMYFTARAPGIAEANAGGAIGFATSPDLMTWTLQPPVYVGSFGQLEVPQVFAHGGRWFCLFCTSSSHWSAATLASHGTPATGTHYLIADHPRGPWRLAALPLLDMDEPCRRYAARIVDTGAGLVIMGFADGGKDKFGGVIMDPEPVTLGPDGLLRVTRKD
jgi:beta-fructofuranosidase